MIWAQWQDEPSIVDGIGFEETRRLAAGRFNQEAEAYFSFWNETPRRYDQYYGWLQALKSQVIREVRWLWRRRVGWFDRAALPKVDAELTAAIIIWCKEARAEKRPRDATIAAYVPAAKDSQSS